MPPDINVLQLTHSNWRSVEQALFRRGREVNRISLGRLNYIPCGSILVFPGVGNLKQLSAEIAEYYPSTDLRNLIHDKRLKVLGICLGFQYLCRESEEDEKAKCLSLFECSVKALYDSRGPSVGWKPLVLGNRSKFPVNIQHKYQKETFYFTHSYGVLCGDGIGHHFGTLDYILDDGRRIVGAAFSENVIGLQFHPEKSGSVGLNFLSDCIEHLAGN